MTELLETEVSIKSSLKEKEILVKSYVIVSEVEDFTPEELAIYYVDKFYFCPKCRKVKRGFALYEEKVNGTFIRKFFLECKHEFSFKELKMLDIDYKDMFSMHVIFKADNKQLIQRARSLIKPFMYWISEWRGSVAWGSLYFYPSYAIDITGAVVEGYGVSFAAPVGNADFGILLGFLDTPNNINTFSLVQKIPHGTGVGQLQYGTTAVSDLAITDSVMIVTISRPFQNGSPQNVIVKEVALVFNWPWNLVNVCMARDVLATPFNAIIGSTFTVYYRLAITIL
jgi:hypothetical protein